MLGAEGGGLRLVLLAQCDSGVERVHLAPLLEHQLLEVPLVAHADREDPHGEPGLHRAAAHQRAARAPAVAVDVGVPVDGIHALVDRSVTVVVHPVAAELRDPAREEVGVRLLLGPLRLPDGADEVGLDHLHHGQDAAGRRHMFPGR